MLKYKTAFVTFFPVIPDNMGSSAVINSRFKNWPYVKKLFQISHIKEINNNKINTVFIKKESPINKIIKLPELIFRIFKFLKKSKNNLIIIEGASWIFYSFIVLFSFKILLPNSKIIYISHSIESEIRKKYSNKLIYYLTKFLERFVFKYSYLSTSVSKLEQNKIKKLYDHKTILYSNAITIDNHNQNRKREIQQDYIIYCGSYRYKPNKNAIDYLNNKIMPSLIKKIPNLKLVLTGGGFDKKLSWIINKGIVPKKDLYNLIYHSKCMCVPLKFGSGTRIKIIEALSLGTIVISTKKGIEGIELINTNPPFIVNDINLFLSTTYKIIRNNKNLKIKSLNDKMFYFKKYSMKNITINFINDYLKTIS
jgi:hypothetical protein